MDQEQREHYKEEFQKLDALRLQHEGLKTALAYLKDDLAAHKNFVSTEISKIHEKIDGLNTRFEELAKDVTGIATKVAMFAVAIGLIANIILKHFNLV